MKPEDLSKMSFDELMNYADKVNGKQMITVNIPEGTDLNDMPPWEKPEVLIPDLRPLEPGVYSCVPSLLRRAFETLQTPQEKEVFLTGALGVFSAIMPNIYGNYFGMPLGTNLYCFVLGKYGTGKGVLTLTRILGEEVHKYRKEKSRELQANYGKKNFIHKSTIYNGHHCAAQWCPLLLGLIISRFPVLSPLG